MLLFALGILVTGIITYFTQRSLYLFCVATDDTYETQYFLLSAADPGAVRGTNYEEVYPLGNVVTVGRDQQETMHRAQTNASHLADAGNYVDYYLRFGETQGNPVFIGLTYHLSDIRASAASLARKETIYAMLHQILLSIICLLLIYHFVLRPLKTVQKNIRLYKDTKDSNTITDNLKTVRTHNAMMGKSPAQILNDTNAAICRNNKTEMFVTVWLGILEISTGKLTAANAGHEYPVLQKKPGGSFALLKDKHGFVIGGMPGMKYKDIDELRAAGAGSAERDTRADQPVKLRDKEDARCFA